MNSLAFCLSVPRPGFEEAFRLLRKLCKPKRGEEAVLSFDGACLQIDCAAMTVTPAAKGSWPGQVRIPSNFLLMLAKLPPAGDPIAVTVDGDRLVIGSCSVKCSIQPAWSKLIELPMSPTFTQILALGFSHSHQEIAAAGYANMFEEARQKTDQRLERAANSLKDFLVTPEELRQFAYDTLKRKLP
jgi:hypothetical protein